MDRPEDFRYGLGYGTVQAVSAESWEVDLLTENGGRVQRALVLGPRLPEVWTRERPQWCVYGYTDHLQGQAVCWPIPSRLPGLRAARKDVVYYDEVLNYRITVTRQNELEIRNANGDAVARLVIRQDGPRIRLETPTLKATLDEPSQLVELDAPHIHLGASAAEKVVLGSTFLAWLQEFIEVFNGHTHPDTAKNDNPAPELPTILSEVSKTV